VVRSFIRGTIVHRYPWKYITRTRDPYKVKCVAPHPPFALIPHAFAFGCYDDWGVVAIRGVWQNDAERSD